MGGLNISVVPAVWGMKLGGIFCRVQGMGFKVERPGSGS